MNAFLYLTSKKAKHSIIDIFKKPSKLITTILIILLVILQIIFGELEGTTGGFAQRDTAEFYAIILAFFTFMFFLISYAGFGRGSSMFTMQDVNLMFLTPTKQKSVLTYGLAQGLSRAVLSSLFLIFQYTWMHDTYQISRWDLLFVLIGYVFTVFIAHMLAMIIYSLTCNSDKVKKLTKAIYFVASGVFALYFISIISANEDERLAILVEKANSTFSHFIPFVGVIRLGVVGLIEFNIVKIMIGIFSIIAFVALYYFVVSKVNFDFYEDVLSSTEISHSAILSRREGKVYEPLPKVVKLGKVGFKQGMGARVILEKDKIQRRRSKIFIFDSNSLINLAMITLVGLVIDDFITIMIVSAYSLMMFSASGTWTKELGLPYAYLIPQKPFKKLIYIVILQFKNVILESLLIYLPLFFMYRFGLTEFLTAIMLRSTFGCLFTAFSLFVRRFLSMTINKNNVVSSMIYILGCSLVCVPSLTYGIVVYNFFGYTFLSAVAAVAQVNLVICIVLVFASRNLLKYVNN
ncbi:MAG: putative ABC exporter domain-containing protein [Clostridia bacterium]